MNLIIKKSAVTGIIYVKIESLKGETLEVSLDLDEMLKKYPRAVYIGVV